MPTLTRAHLLSEALGPQQLALLRDLVTFGERVAAVKASAEPDLGALATVHDLEARLRARALEVLPPHPGHVPPRAAVEAFCVGAWMLRHYERTVLGDGELIDTVGSRTLRAFRTDLDTSAAPDGRLRRALRRAFALTDAEEARIDAVMRGELDALAERHAIVEALDARFGLAPDAPDLSARVHALFGALYRGHPLVPGDVGLVRTGTSLFFTVPRRVDALSGHRGRRADAEVFLDRLHGFQDRQLGHFPVFGPFLADGADPALLDFVAERAGLPVARVTRALTTMVTTLATEVLDKYLWHDLWGHQWQSHLLPYEDDFREMARFRRWPDVTARFTAADGGEVSLAGLVGDAAVRWLEGAPVSDAHWDRWLDAVMSERLSVVASGMVSEILADVVEYKFLVLAPGAAASLPSSSLFRDRPTKLDLVIDDLVAFHAFAASGLERLIAEPDGGDRLRAALARVLPVAPDAALDAALAGLRARCRARLDGVFAGTLAPRGDEVGALGRLALNLVGLCATLEDLYDRLATVGDPYPAPLRDFRDLMVLSTGAFHQLAPAEHLWHLDEFLGLHFEGCLRAFVGALAMEEAGDDDVG